MPFVIKIVGVGSSFDQNFTTGESSYIKSYDPEAFVGAGLFEQTEDLKEALQFESAKAALECWQTIPKSRPLRDDGKPNKPLTALSIEVVKLDA